MGLLGFTRLNILLVRTDSSLIRIVGGFGSIGSISLSLLGFLWWIIDLCAERNQLGYNCGREKDLLGWGFIWFIVAESCIFARFFCCWFYCGLGQNSQVLLGAWPPEGLDPIHPFKIPALNTLLLLSSAIRVTWCHRCVTTIRSLTCSSRGKSYWASSDPSRSFSKKRLRIRLKSYFGGEFKSFNLSIGSRRDSNPLLEGKNKYISIENDITRLRSSAIFSNLLTIIFGLTFTGFQMYEFYWARFTFADRVYGSCFFLLTGFHGSHVVAGLYGLLVSLWQIYNNGYLYRRSILSFNCAYYYWHFVDLVWLGVYISLYIWPYYLA